MTKRKRTRTDSDLQNTTQKTKARATRTTIKTGDELISHFKTILQPIKPAKKKEFLAKCIDKRRETSGSHPWIISDECYIDYRYVIAFIIVLILANGPKM